MSRTVAAARVGAFIGAVTMLPLAGFFLPLLLFADFAIGDSEVRGFLGLVIVVGIIVGAFRASAWLQRRSYRIASPLPVLLFLSGFLAFWFLVALTWKSD